MSEKLFFKEKLFKEVYKDLDLIKNDVKQFKKIFIKLSEIRKKGKWLQYKTLSYSALSVINRIERESFNEQDELSEEFLEWFCFVEKEIQALQKEMDVQLEQEDTRFYKDLQNIMDNLVNIFKRFEVLLKRKKLSKIEWINSDKSKQKDVAELIEKLFVEVQRINSSEN